MSDYYKLYTDKDTLFECHISLEGASLREADIRLMIETPTLNLMFKGSVNENGKCTVPIQKLKSLIDSGVTGNIKLEVIADGTYFQPWQSPLEIETEKRITVEVVTPLRKSPSVSVKVNSPKKDVVAEDVVVDSIVNSLIREGITAKNVTDYKKLFNQIVDKQLKKSNEILSRGKIISRTINELAAAPQSTSSSTTSARHNRK